ncbi:kinase-like domain-containing protein [Xylariomycetidae sp. FL0641]|nr:kinase-like domain-containing protein [Xylariomycetidae sp. FL0641]
MAVPPSYYVATGLEDIENTNFYIPGGYHPIHLGDILDRRFQVIHKLGAGGYATVWLCYDIDNEKWRAVKVIRAQASLHERQAEHFMKSIREEEGFDPAEWEAAHIVLPLEYFWLEGPNGKHLCEVLPVLGPSLDYDWENILRKAEPVTFKRLLRQVVEGLQYLHSKGIVHGDLRTSNVLYHIRDISAISFDDMLDMLPEPIESSLVTMSGEDPGPQAPNYVVSPVDISCFGLTDRVAIIDFGEAFRVGQAPGFLGIPGRFAAPEAKFLRQPGPGVDIWSLAFTMLDVRVGYQGVLKTPTYAYIVDLERMLGPLPRPLRDAFLRSVDEGWRYKDELLSKATRMGRFYRRLKENINPDVPATLPENADAAVDWMRSKLDATGYKDRILAELAEERTFYEVWESDDDDDPSQPVKTSFKVPDEEVRVLGDLLTKMIKYNPEERITLDEVLGHEWFDELREDSSGESEVLHMGSWDNLVPIGSDNVPDVHELDQEQEISTTEKQKSMIAQTDEQARSDILTRSSTDSWDNLVPLGSQDTPNVHNIDQKSETSPLATQSDTISGDSEPTPDDVPTGEDPGSWDSLVPLGCQDSPSPHDLEQEREACSPEEQSDGITLEDEPVLEDFTTRLIDPLSEEPLSSRLVRRNSAPPIL